MERGQQDTASLSFVDTAEALRAENRSHRILTVDEAVELVRAGVPLAAHPLIGGLPPEIAWRYLKTCGRGHACGAIDAQVWTHHTHRARRATWMLNAIEGDRAASPGDVRR